MTPGPTTPDTIVLIHGLWMTPLCWEHWIRRYTARGFRVLAPAWPGIPETEAASSRSAATRTAWPGSA
jgi:alpha-beta hydrolase superfamily lysophospholipase